SSCLVTLRPRGWSFLRTSATAKYGRCDCSIHQPPNECLGIIPEEGVTLLVSIAGHGFALSCSDTRISVKERDGFKSVDEKFNKHIIFHSAGLTANVAYTGIAQWSKSGQTVKMYDVISESL